MKSIGYAGIIASGKTTFAETFVKRALGKPYKYQDTIDFKIDDAKDVNIIHENVEKNYYLKQFYTNMHKWANKLEHYVIMNRSNDREIEFLIGKSALHTTDKDEFILHIEDRTVYEDIIFVEMLHDSKHLSDDQYNDLWNLYKEVVADITLYSTIYWIKITPELAYERMNTRKRDIETGLPLEYLKQLSDKYEKIFLSLIPKETKVIIIDNTEELTKH